MLVSLGCSDTFISFVQLLKIPIISTAGERYYGNSKRHSVGHMRWKEPRSEEFSKIVKEILLKQDWFEIVILYDGEEQKQKRLPIISVVVYYLDMKLY